MMRRPCSGVAFVVATMACIGVGFGAAAVTARADTLSFASGIESNGNTGDAPSTCSVWSSTGGSVGLTRNKTHLECTRHYFMPLYWRTFLGAGVNRTVSITYRRAAADAQVECSVFVFNSEGVPTSSSSVPMPVTGANYGTVNFVVNNIVSTGTSFVSCTQGPTGSSWLLKINWTP